MKFSLFFLPIFLLLLRYFPAQAQNSAVLDEYVRTGLAGNLALQQQQIDLQKSLESIRQAKSLFYPTISFNASYTRALGGRNTSLPIGDLLNPVYTTLNQITQSSAFPQVDNQTIQFLPDNFQETKVKFAYPLFNSDLRYNRRIQEQLYTGKVAQKAALEQELRYQITGAYLQYLQALEAEKVWLNTKTVLTELRRFNESLVRNNVATRDVVAIADYELSKADNEIYKLRSSQNTARAYFNFLINKDLQTEVAADTALLQVVLPAYQADELIRQALANRQEFAALRAGLAAAETDVQRNDAQRKLPDLYLGGEFGFQGFGYNFGGDQAYALGQIGLTYDLYDAGQRKSKSQVARLENEKVRTQLTQTEQQIALQVTQSWNAFEAARNTYATALVGLRAAEETFRIVNNKYRASQVLLIEFLEAQNRVTTARLQATLARMDILLKEAALRQAAGL